MKNNHYLISIIIPTLNAGAYLERLLSIISTQSIIPHEVLVIDSSSTDATASIARHYNLHVTTLHVFSIEQQDFSHGKTRNLAASMAQGEILVFLTQDAMPASCDWLKNLVAPFRDKAVGCVFGRHLARPGGNPVIAMDIERHFDSFGCEEYSAQQVDWSSEVSIRDYRLREGWYCFNSNVNSAIRKDIWERIGFRDVTYSEDQLFGKDIIEAGYKKVYARNAAVYHSHELTLPEYFRRYFDEYRGLKNTLGFVDNTGIISFLPLVMLATCRDIYHLTGKNIDNKPYWLLYTPFFHMIRKAGAFLGGRYERIPPVLRKFLSLESKA